MGWLLKMHGGLTSKTGIDNLKYLGDQQVKLVLLEISNGWEIISETCIAQRINK